MDNFKDYINLNKLDINIFYKIMEEYLVNEMLISIVNYLKKDNNKMILKGKLLHCNDEKSRSLIIKTYVRKVLSVECTDIQQKYLLQGIYAYMRKSSIRKTNSPSIKGGFYIKQDGKCNICHKDFKKDDMEVDHKLAFDFVGDELNSNLQLLCKNCNLKKATNYDYPIKKFLLK